MMKKLQQTAIILSASILSSCVVDDTPSYTATAYDAYSYNSMPYNAQSVNYDSNYFYPDGQQQQQVNVPDSYHVGNMQSPTPPKDMDRNWVSSQNPQGYTIMLSEGDKASQVAGALFKAPKNEHMAQVKNARGSYQGLYGSYNSMDEARQALDKLPAELRNNANIKDWGSVQGGMGN